MNTFDVFPDIDLVDSLDVYEGSEHFSSRFSRFLQGFEYFWCTVNRFSRFDTFEISLDIDLVDSVDVYKASEHFWYSFSRSSRFLQGFWIPSTYN